jgi:hypothetical protein
VSIDHVILTRFNLPSKGPESLIRAKDGWLQRRVAFFEQYTIPSVVAQTVSGCHWIVYFDPESPRWLLERLGPHAASGVFTPIFREEATWREVGEDARQLTGARGRLLITTNLDNDDALAADFLARIQRLARPGETLALFLEQGLIAFGERAYLRCDRDNAFCSVAEPWTKEPATAWRDWHTMLRKHMPVIVSAGAPGWLQVVHGENVSNRVRGRLVDPTCYRGHFPGLIDGLPRPRAGVVAVDLLVAAPLRMLREGLRAAAKVAFLFLGGKQSLDRVKLLLGPSQRGRHS